MDLILQTCENMKKDFQMIVYCLIVAPLIFSYKYQTVIQVFQNDTVNIAACVDPLKTEDLAQIHNEPSADDNMGKTDLRIKKKTISTHISNLDCHASKSAINKKLVF